MAFHHTVALSWHPILPMAFHHTHSCSSPWHSITHSCSIRQEHHTQLLHHGIPSHTVALSGKCIARIPAHDQCMQLTTRALHAGNHTRLSTARSSLQLAILHYSMHYITPACGPIKQRSSLKHKHERCTQLIILDRVACSPALPTSLPAWGRCGLLNTLRRHERRTQLLITPGLSCTLAVLHCLPSSSVGALWTAKLSNTSIAPTQLISHQG